MNHGNTTQQLSGTNRWIILREGVAAGDPSDLALLLALSNHAMDKEAALSYDQRDVTDSDMFSRIALDDQEIARPDRRKHAGSQSLQPHAAPGPQNVRCKTALVAFASLRRH